MVMLSDLPTAQTPLADGDLTLVSQSGVLKKVSKEQFVLTDASDISFDPTLSGMSAVNMQTAIEELQNDIASTLTDVTIEDTITNGTTDKAPSSNAVYDALALKQPLDTTLTALAAYNSNGLLVQTTADTFTSRTIQAASSMTNGSGVSGNPSIDLGTVTTAHVTEVTDKNYVTDDQLSILGNTTNTNSGDQLVFKTISVVGQSDIVADGLQDTLTFIAGSHITLTTNAGTDTLTITGDLGTAVISDITTESGSDRIVNMVSLTQVEYNSLTPNSTTLYIIVG